jgi:hypothetical protein
MQDGETIADMQQRFVKITNKLHGLGKPITNQDATKKILRCLNRSWQPKVTAIKEANDLTTLSLTTLFGKLTEHEQVLSLLEKHEKGEKKEKHHEKEKEKDKITTSKRIHSKKICANYSSSCCFSICSSSCLWISSNCTFFYIYTSNIKKKVKKDIKKNC